MRNGESQKLPTNKHSSPVVGKADYTTTNVMYAVDPTLYTPPYSALDSPERLLLRMLLQDAIETFLHPPRSVKYVWWYRDVVNWFAPKPALKGFVGWRDGLTFAFVCECLDLNEDELRRALYKKKNAKGMSNRRRAYRQRVSP